MRLPPLGRSAGRPCACWMRLLVSRHVLMPSLLIGRGLVRVGGCAHVQVGASPEMYVRSKGSSIETCPISGTIKRGATAIEDAQNIKELLNNEKEESEITMCTDVDRNDKSRICKPGSVQVVGRRQIEMYSRLIHTVDHVKGELREGFDALDAFLAHTWAVTVTGAPNPDQIRERLDYWTHFLRH